MDPLLYSVADAAPALGIGETQLRALIDAGRVPVVELSEGGLMYIRRCDLEVFVANLRPRARGQPVQITNPVRNQEQPHRQSTGRTGREPITPIRQSANQEGKNA